MTTTLEQVPQVYVLPPKLFDATGENFGDVEFPIYFNYFVKKAFQDPGKSSTYCPSNRIQF
jgi:hypothetical protein